MRLRASFKLGRIVLGLCRRRCLRPSLRQSWGRACQPSALHAWCTTTYVHTRTRARTHAPAHPLTPSTHARARSCVAKHGLGKWSEIAHDLNKLLAGPHHRKRSSKQCRERWIHHLSPSVNKGVSWECVLRRGTKSCCEHGTHA